MKHPAANILSALLLSTILLCSCTEHFITDSAYRKQVDKDLKKKIEALGGKFSPKEALSHCDGSAEKEALEFLYAYMPVGDVIDYDYTLYLNGIRSSFQAQKEMPWGALVPEDLFRHFVLPLRVNNENMDNSREVFYEELRGRVKGMSMYDAALEVNRWCHEKVIYTPSDSRTSSPLATVRTAYGRCGEESVFTVAALRSVGIPARQVYTPRWAHTDDNHAWVEAWVDGRWHYLGACEPEPRLDVAWFSSTAQRSLLMHSKVFGKYSGKEDIISVTDCYTEINVTSNYAPTEKLKVMVVDEDGKKVKGAKVEFKIYNYAEFYSAITAYTDMGGNVSATFGKGDILIWASDNGRFGYKKVSVGKGNPSITLFLDKKPGTHLFQEIDIVPPVEGENIQTLSPEEIEENKIMLAKEDSIRALYTATFATFEDAEKLGHPRDNDKLYKYLQAARGNWREISKYISQLNSDTYGIGLTLLDLISEKDLRDTPAEILLDNIRNYTNSSADSPAYTKKDSPTDNETFTKYVLNPRVANELLTPYKGYFKKLSEEDTFGSSTPLTPETIIKYTKKVRLADNLNPQLIPVTPIGVSKIMAADSRSRDIFFVSLCRSANIPARIEEISGKLQYYDGKHWNDISLDTATTSGSSSNSSAAVANSNTSSNTAAANASNSSTATDLKAPKPKGNLILTYTPTKHLDNPKYETHFTIANLDNLSIHTLNFTDKEGREGSMSWKSIFATPVELDCGNYLLTTGTRMASGKVLATLTFFTIKEGPTTEVKLVMREDPADLQVIGAMNPEARFQLLLPSGAFSESSILECTGRGFFVLGFLKANHEPSNHAIRSLFANAPTRPTILFYQNQQEYNKFATGGFPSAPEKIHFGIDRSNSILNSICSEMKISSPQLPLFVIADTFGRIVYISQGYQIGIAEQLRI